MRGTEKAEDAVSAGPDTSPEDLWDFVERRIQSPEEVEVEMLGTKKQIQVFNFSTHKVDMEALRRVAPSLQNERYIIPYQVPGVWGYLIRLLPRELAQAELLVYSKRSESYKAFPNFRRVATDEADETFRDYLGEVLEKNVA